MSSLRHWRPRRIVAAWLLWIIGLLALGGVAAYRGFLESRRELEATLPPGAVVLPAQASDFVVALPPPDLLALAAVLFGPPALLTATWLVSRSSRV